MEYLLIIIGICLLIIGIIGSILPIIPGPPIGYLGMLLLHFTSRFEFSLNVLIVYGILMVVITVADYIIPIYATKKMGGSKHGMWGCTVGMIVGLFIFPPFGIIFGPFVGALVGELIKGQKTETALKSALGSFIGFLFGTLIKLIFGIILFYNVVVNFITHL